MSTVAKYLRWLLAQWEVNLSSAMAYRVSFLSQLSFMLVNNVLLLFFWWVLLQLVPDIGGWGMADIWLMYGLSAGGFSLVSLFAGNSFRLANIIAEGQLDYYLALPKNVLLHVLISRSDFAAIGDLLFGLILGKMGCRALGATICSSSFHDHSWVVSGRLFTANKQLILLYWTQRSPKSPID